QRSPPSLLTTAACGGLRPAPDCRPRRALLHLSYSSAPSYSDRAFVTHAPFRTFGQPNADGSAGWIAARSLNRKGRELPACRSSRLTLPARLLCWSTLISGLRRNKHRSAGVSQSGRSTPDHRNESVPVHHRVQGGTKL